ncbi:hypothetical protein [Kitasatospora viridis]|uniref:Uncharacterized protein n=1 Tax=Kitasatospora viridis TaxID=281105 RepID=A0A561T604_9ACTN|nr:hypothetical protein [Kitasatospora viridis]TWF82542.1 hypothetical protein FHX73_1424 [Kitasatospora viridis]
MNLVTSPDSGRPARTLLGFVLLLAALFGASYGVGRLAGPTAPATGGPDRPVQQTDMPGMRMDGLATLETAR